MTRNLSQSDTSSLASFGKPQQVEAILMGQSGCPDLRPFPMQDGPSIPWFMAEAIWASLYRNSQPLDQVARRGGFGWDEVAYMWGPKHGTTREQRRVCEAHIQAATAALSESLARPDQLTPRGRSDT